MRIIFQGDEDEEDKELTSHHKSLSGRLWQMILRLVEGLQFGMKRISSRLWTSVNICFNSIDTKTYSSIE